MHSASAMEIYVQRSISVVNMHHDVLTLKLYLCCAQHELTHHRCAHVLTTMHQLVYLTYTLLY